MTKIEIINEIIVKKQEELVEVKLAVKKLEDARTDVMFSVMQNYFGGEFTLDDVYIQRPTYGYSGTTYEIKRPNKDYKYEKLSRKPRGRSIQRRLLNEDNQTRLIIYK